MHRGASFELENIYNSPSLQLWKLPSNEKRLMPSLAKVVEMASPSVRITILVGEKQAYNSRRIIHSGQDWLLKLFINMVLQVVESCSVTSAYCHS